VGRGPQAATAGARTTSHRSCRKLRGRTDSGGSAACGLGRNIFLFGTKEAAQNIKKKASAARSAITPRLVFVSRLLAKPRAGKRHHPECGAVNGTNRFAVRVASVMSVPPWLSAAGTKLAAVQLPRSLLNHRLWCLPAALDGEHLDHRQAAA
jgi:hypothetical protein